MSKAESAEEKQQIYKQIEEIFQEVFEHDLKADLEDKIDPNGTIQLNVNRRFMEDKRGRQSGIPVRSLETQRITQELLGGNYGR